MAVTITKSPQNFSPASNPCEFEFSSTQTGQSNFTFIVELTVNGALHSTHQVFTESGIYGSFDCSQILRSFFDSQLETDGTLELPTGTNRITYSISVQDKYGATPIPQGTATSSSTLEAINGSLRFDKWIDYDFNDYELTAGGGLLSYFPSTANRFCALDESIFLGLIVTSGTYDLTFRLLNSSGGVVATETLTANVSPTSNLLYLDVSPTTIISETTITLANFEAAYSYDVTVFESGGGSVGTSIIIDRECSLYDGQRLHWLNKFGAWESYTFNLYSEEKTNVNADEYQRNIGEWNGTTREYSRLQGERLNIAKRANDTMSLNSDWIKEDLQQWLVRSLYESPKVYLEISHNVFEPVIVSSSNYTLKQRVKEGLIREDLRIRRTYEYRSQLN